jgi:type IV fimbrial biogenesis protein FimT
MNPRPAAHDARRRRRPSRGVTLVEAAVALAVTAILVGLAIPSFEQARQRRHLEGAAQLFETDVQHARSLAVARQQTVRLSFDATASAGCYVVHTGAANACTCAADGAAVCSAGAEALRAVRLDGASSPTLRANVRAIAFDAVRGTVTPTVTVRLVAPGGEAIHQIVNVMGRVRSCSPAPALPGYPAC